ncbi:MAG: hypothetical protein ACLPVF_06755 [Acidimicrobiales bacterium]
MPRGVPLGDGHGGAPTTTASRWRGAGSSPPRGRSRGRPWTTTARARIGPDGPAGAQPGVPVLDMGYEFYPAALAH